MSAIAAMSHRGLTWSSVSKNDIFWLESRNARARGCGKQEGRRSCGHGDIYRASVGPVQLDARSYGRTGFAEFYGRRGGGGRVLRGEVRHRSGRSDGERRWSGGRIEATHHVFLREMRFQNRSGYGEEYEEQE